MELACHYTTIDVLHSMLDRLDEDQKDKKAEDPSLTFWASSIYSMNDPQEFVYGYKLLQNDILPNVEKKIEIKEEHLKLSKLWQIQNYQNAQEWNNTIISKIYEQHRVPFIVSFSKHEDYLPMWNAYANKGNGVCLCFNNYDYIYNDIYNNNNIDLIPYLHAKDVTYGCVDETIRNAVHLFYKSYFEKYQNENEIVRKQKMMSSFSALTLVISPYCKHKAYEYENETRLIQFKNSEDDVKYRVNKQGRLIPYIEVPVKLKYLNKIIVGPCADSHSIIRELRNRLNKYIDNRNDIIIPSEVPYREY